MDEAPTGSAGGQSGVSGLATDLPDKLRVHALARLVGSTSKDVLAALAALGQEVRSVQANVSRATAEQVVAALAARVPDALAGAVEPDAAGATVTPAEAGIAAPPGEPDAAGESGEPTPGVGALATAPAAPAVPAVPAVEESSGAAPTGLAPIFNAAPMFQPPTTPVTPTRPAAAADGGTDGGTEPADGSTEAQEPAPERKKPSGKKGRKARSKDAGAEPGTDVSATPEVAAEESGGGESDADGPDDESDDDAGARRRRRRGRRGRGRGRGGEGDDDTDTDTDTDTDSDTDDDAAEDTGASGDDDGEDDATEGGGSRRRRRRRRRGGADAGDDRGDDDPPNTVTRVRQPRDKDSGGDPDDGVQSVRGSTRLEAKRQRRRDGRDAGRRRPPILSESEFLARRESVDRSMVIRQLSDRTEIGVLEDDVLVEHFITGGRSGDASMVGNIYLGRVQNVLPSMEAAFVDIGRGRNAVLYAGEVNWDAAGLNGKARKIEQALSSGDQVLVQVTKDPVGHKGARLTTQISLAGRFLVYVPSGSAAGISRKLPDVERKRLKDMLKEIVPADAGVIIRTASEGVSHEALERDVRRLQAQWEVIKEKSARSGPKPPKAPTLLYEEPDMLVRVVRDQFNEDFSRLTISGDDAWDTVSGYVAHVAPELADRMHRHVGPSDVFTDNRIDEQLLKALDRKVWLPSGGTLVIDRTEAMTVVDVNTGKFTGSGGNLEETVTRNNLEAAEEVVRQLRLRDIGGIIVVDFIDMVLEANRDLVLRRLTECLARDRTRHQVAEVTSLGLVQMTRKRVGGGLLEHFSTPCEHCRGRGVIVSADGSAEGEHHHGNGGQNGQNGQNGQGNGSGDGGGRRSRGRGRRGGSDRGRVEVDTSSAVAGVALVEAATRSATAGGHAAAGAAGTPVVAESTVVDAAPAPEPTTDAETPPLLVDEPVAAGTVPAGVPEPSGAGAPSPDSARSAGLTGSADPAGSAGSADSSGAAGLVTGVAPVGAESAVSAPADAAEVEPGDVVVGGVVAADTVAGDAVVGRPVTPDVTGRVDASAPTDTSAGSPAPLGAETPETDEEEGAAAPSAGREPGARRRRVSRSAGAPSTSVEPVVITTSTPDTEDPAEPEAPATSAVPVLPQPEPAVVATRPRRTRRTASRPAGPPVDGPATGTATVEETDTDPV